MTAIFEKPWSLIFLSSGFRWLHINNCRPLKASEMMSPRLINIFHDNNTVLNQGVLCCKWSFFATFYQSFISNLCNVSCDGIFRKLIIGHFQYNKKFRWGYCTNITSYFGDNIKWRDRQWEVLSKESLLLPITWVCTWRNVSVGIRHLSRRSHDWYVSNSIFFSQCFPCIWYVSSWKIHKA